MSTITSTQVKDLRDKTGVSVMQCKKALEEADGDMEKAILILKKTSSDIALKKAGRETSQGTIAVASNDTSIALALLLCETDFVAKNEDFLALSKKVAELALSEGEEKARTDAAEHIAGVVQKIGENIQLGELHVLPNNATTNYYLHSGKTAAVVELKGGTKDLAREVAMHACAMKPEWSLVSEVPADTLENVRELMKKEVDTTKPADIQTKILEGKVAGYLAERVLTEQSFIKNPDVTVGRLMKDGGAELLSLKLYTI